MAEDYVWSDGKIDLATTSYDYAVRILEEAKRGKIWKRTFNEEDGLLEGIEDVTPPKKH